MRVLWLLLFLSDQNFSLEISVPQEIIVNVPYTGFSIGQTTILLRRGFVIAVKLKYSISWFE